MIALWYFANTECYKSIASRFDVSDFTVMNSVDEIVSIMMKEKNKLIRCQKKTSCVEMKMASELFKVYVPINNKNIDREEMLYANLYTLFLNYPFLSGGLSTQEGCTC